MFEVGDIVNSVDSYLGSKTHLITFRDEKAKVKKGTVQDTHLSEKNEWHIMVDGAWYSDKWLEHADENAQFRNKLLGRD